ncbi:MAG: hypothetical protein ACJAU6_004114 [Alphaproteobacteria bacterium]|jgi:hypothetical protein
MALTGLSVLLEIKITTIGLTVNHKNPSLGLPIRTYRNRYPVAKFDV